MEDPEDIDDEDLTLFDQVALFCLEFALYLFIAFAMAGVWLLIMMQMAGGIR